MLLENAANQGISQLISKVLGKGTKSLSSEQIADQIESTGGSLDPFSGNNTIGASLECLNTDWASSLDLLADVMLHPSIPEDVLTIERQSQLAAIKSQKDQLVQLAFRWIGESLCGNQSYGLNASGTQTSVSSLERPHLLEFHDKLLAPSSSVVAIYGDIRHQEIRTHVENLLSDWHDLGRFTQYPAPPQLQLKSNQTGYIHVDKTQAVVAVGFQGTTIHSTDKFALELLQEVYSDLGSRLFTRIRDDLGLAYYVSAYHFAGIHPGVFAFYAGTSPDQSDLVADEFLKEILHVTSHGITQEELNRALAKILGQKKINAQSIGSMAMTAALDELYGLGHENYHREIEAYTRITLDDIRLTAEKYFSTQPHALVFVSPKPPKRPHQVVTH
ncbi:MAG: insulinase family protein [Verrucomicrobia bacterium]|nr:insulinase family protein [Verrucomicrobiota bacterium]